MGIIAWVIFGALAGWATSQITGDKRGCLGNIILGIVGAFVGGLLMQFLTGAPFDFGFNIMSFVVAVLGAIVLLVLVGVARKSLKR